MTAAGGPAGDAVTTWRAFWSVPGPVPLLGVRGREARPWHPGVNTASCLYFGHPAPGPRCECGFTVTDDPAGVRAYVVQVTAALRAARRLHNDAGHPRVPADLGGRRLIVAAVAVGGRRAGPAAEDEAFFYRVERAQVVRLWAPADDAGRAAAIEHAVGAPVDVSEHGSPGWLDAFQDPAGPRPEDLGCGMCPTPNPGRHHYPLCRACAHSARTGGVFGQVLTTRTRRRRVRD